MKELRDIKFPKWWLFIVPVLFFSVCLLVNNAESLPKKGIDRYSYDNDGYFQPLPAFLIYKDLSYSFLFQFKPEKKNEFMTNQQAYSWNKYGYGPAFLLAPFYLVGYLMDRSDPKLIPKGYSPTYLWTIAIGAAFYASLGLLLLGFLLRRYTSSGPIIFTQVILAFGCGLIYYATTANMLSHVYSFFLFSLLLILTDAMYERRDQKYLIWIGLTLGLIGATRMVNLVVGLIPLLYNVRSWSDFRLQFAFIFRFPLIIILSALFCIIPMIPFYVYIHEITGTYFFDTYPGEHFFFTDPLIGRVLFGFRKGWFIYSPLLLLGFIGLLFCRKWKNYFSLLITVLLVIYIVSSWGCWWYGGSFGMRALVEVQALLCFGFAGIIGWFLRSRIRSYILVSFITIFVLLNNIQTHQYSHGILHWNAMTAKSYFAIFGYIHPVDPSIIEKRDKNLSLPGGDYNNSKVARRAIE